MVYFLIGLYDHITHAYFQHVTYLVLEDHAHHSQLYYSRILETQRHRFVEK